MLALGITEMAGANAKAVEQIHQELLKSLQPRVTNWRFRNVKAPHERTFEWVFKNTELKFLSWLESSPGLYWCRGRPGSGKSTLMKWLFNDSRTINAWSNRRGRKIRASFFFHDRGSVIQKSFQGLLQAIVHQVLRQAPELFDLVAPIHDRDRDLSDTEWTAEDIQEAFDVLRKQQILELDVVLFLDALDEYNGRHETFANFLIELVKPSVSGFTSIKVCFSSRPLQVFMDKFQDVPGFDIHEHTGEDILLYIESRMLGNPRMCRVIQQGSQKDVETSEEFVHKLHSRAHGIFLWVELVLDLLLWKFTDGLTLVGLKESLDILPDDLEAFYQNTLDRLPSGHSEDAKVIFEVLRCAYNPVQLHDLYEICRYTNVSHLLLCKLCTLSDHCWDLDSAQRWIHSRTCGLVELICWERAQDLYWEAQIIGTTHFCPRPFRSDEPIYIVEFLHQTVKIFSQSPSWLRTPPVDRFPCHNGNAYIAKYILALLFQVLQGDLDLWAGDRPVELGSHNSLGLQPNSSTESNTHALTMALAEYMQRAACTNQQALVHNLTEFGDERVYELFNLIQWHSHFDNLSVNSVEAFAVTFANYSILQELLELSPGKVKSSVTPLLHLAIATTTQWQHYDITPEARSKTIQILVEHGADMHATYGGHTI